jgi:iron(III) transport system ATP-binding protein
MQRDLGFTAIYVTHDQSEAMELADRIAVMDHGRIAQIGAPREMYELPDSVHVARFLGQSNEIPFVVEQVDLGNGTIRGSSALGDLTALFNSDGQVAPPSGSKLAAFGRPGDFEIATDSGTEGPGGG